MAEITKEAYLETQRRQEKEKAGYEEKQKFGSMVETQIEKYIS